jgi:hypothetical protein
MQEKTALHQMQENAARFVAEEHDNERNVQAFLKGLKNPPEAFRSAG